MSKGRSKGQQQKAAGKDDWQKQQVKAFAKHKLTATSGKRELHRQPSTRHVLCCAVLCCAVLCCAVLCCAVLCCAVSTGKQQRSIAGKRSGHCGVSAHNLFEQAASISNIIWYQKARHQWEAKGRHRRGSSC